MFASKIRTLLPATPPTLVMLRLRAGISDPDKSQVMRQLRQHLPQPMTVITLRSLEKDSTKSMGTMLATCNLMDAKLAMRAGPMLETSGVLTLYQGLPYDQCPNSRPAGGAIPNARQESWDDAVQHG